MAFSPDMSNVSGTSGNDDLRANYGDTDGTQILAGAGNDVLRGGSYNDILVGGSGDDLLWGGLGADEYRFFGDEIDGASDLDKVLDIKFSEGDTLVFGDYAAGTFFDDTGSNEFDAGSSVIISSWEGLANMVEDSALVGAARLGATDALVLTLDNGSGQTQVIHIHNAWAAYVAAGGTTDAVGAPV